MNVLYFLESIRVPFLDTVMLFVTKLGEESFFLFLALLIYWCIDKKSGYYVLTACFFGIVANQFLKIVCRIDRPWILDKNFTIVESAREQATGYSFPSGHTQNAASAFGMVAARIKYKKVFFRVLCITAIVLVSLSRMYLGVHTPYDVGVSLLIALFSIMVLQFISKAEDKNPNIFYFVIGVALALSTAFLLYMLFNRFPSSVDAANLASAYKNAHSLFGATLGLSLAYFIENKYIKFQTKAPLIAQILKLIIGAVLAISIKTFTKQPLLDLFGGSDIAHTVRYFITVVFAGMIYPLTFKYFARIGAKKQPQKEEENV